MDWFDGIISTVQAAAEVVAGTINSAISTVSNIASTAATIASSIIPSDIATAVVNTAVTVVNDASKAVSNATDWVISAGEQAIAATWEHDIIQRVTSYQETQAGMAQAAAMAARIAAAAAAARKAAEEAAAAALKTQETLTRQVGETTAIAITAAEMGGLGLRPPDLNGLMKMITDWIQNPALQLPTDPAFAAVAKLIWDAGRPLEETVRIIAAMHKFIYHISLIAGEPDSMSDDEIVLLAEAFLLPVPLLFGAAIALTDAVLVGALIATAVAIVLALWHRIGGKKPPKTERLVNAALGKTLSRPKTIEQLAAFAIKDPVKFVIYGKQMGQEKFFRVMQELKGAAGGDAAGKAIVTEIAKNTWMAKWAPLLLKMPKLLFTTGLTLAGFALVGLWGMKEIPEYPGFATWAAIEAENWPAAMESLERYERWTAEMEAWPPGRAILLLPVLGAALRAVLDSQAGQAKTFRAIIEQHLPQSAQVTVLVSPSNCRVTINGVPHAVRDSWRFELAPGQYLIEASKDGYISQSQRITLAAGEMHSPITFDLQQGASGAALVTISSYPSAEIWVSGTDTGRLTPTEMSFVPGRIDIELRQKGYRTEIVTLYLNEGRNDPVSVTLEADYQPKDETHAYVSIYVIPLGAYVFVNDVITRYPSPTHLDLPPGTYRITIRKSGYIDIEDSINVTAGETVRKEYVMEEKPTEAPPRVEVPPGEDVWNVTVETVPAGGRTFINGSLWRYPAPTVIPLLAGTYEFRFTLKGYKEVLKTYTIP